MAKARGNLKAQMEFFRNEYSLNHLIGTCKKPIVSLLDGVTSTDYDVNHVISPPS